jgi:hypothetical protein
VREAILKADFHDGLLEASCGCSNARPCRRARSSLR